MQIVTFKGKNFLIVFVCWDWLVTYTKHQKWKFQEIAQKLKKSPNSRLLFVQLCCNHECKKPHSIHPDVRILWNSKYIQLKGIFRCSEAMLVFFSYHKKQKIPHQSNLLFAVLTGKKINVMAHPEIITPNKKNLDLACNLIEILQPFWKFTLKMLICGGVRISNRKFSFQPLLFEGKPQLFWDIVKTSFQCLKLVQIW